jgi:hypothetical protein
LAGAALSGTLREVLLDVSNRWLSSREEARVGTAAYFAVDKIKARLESGENPRKDNFFEKSEQTSRSYADEIFEGALLKSKNEHEEKKIKIIANIFAETVFHSEISASEANHVLQLAESITYRQMCLIAVFEQKDDLEGIKLATVKQENKPIIDDLSTLQEVFQLQGLGLVAQIRDEFENSDGFHEGSIGYGDQNYEAMFILDDVIPNRIVLTELGKRYSTIMNLSEIPKKDLMKVAKTLTE